MLNENSLATLEVHEVKPADLSPLWDKVQQLIEASVASETRRVYAIQLKKFATWCNNQGFQLHFPVAPEILAAYVAHLAENKVSCSTIEQSMAAIATAHRAENFASPTENLLVKKVVKGYKREHGTAKHKKDAATVDIIRCLLSAIPQDNSPKNIRDRAIIALGFAGAFRRSELCALDYENLKWTFKDNQEILLVEVRKSKTDQEGHGMTKAIFPSNNESISPTALLKSWLSISKITSGSLFRNIRKSGHITEKRLTPQSIRLIIQKTSFLAKLSLDLSAHSLRSGFVTTAIRQGKTERSIMNQTGHKSTQILREYFMREDAIEDNAAQNLM